MRKWCKSLLRDHDKERHPEVDLFFGTSAAALNEQIEPLTTPGSTRVRLATLANIKFDAANDQPNAFFSKAMKPCHDTGRLDRDGAGITKRCKALLSNYVARAGPIDRADSSMSTSIEDAIRLTARRY